MFKTVLRFDRISPIKSASKVGDKTKPEQEWKNNKRDKQLCQDFIEAYQTAVKADEEASKKGY